jgi:23S rRNA (uracil1939-C5)-methyltransferase
MPAIHELFTARVRDMSSEGAAIVEHASGQVFFVPGVWLGEVGEFRVTGFKKRFGFAELVNLLEPAPDRVAAPCRHHGFGKQHCGGCPWQFVAYEAQLQVKEARVRRTLARLGAGDVVQPVWASAAAFGYRNRAQFKSDGRAIGYVAAGSNQLVAIEDCLILSDHNRQTLDDLRATLPNPAFRPGKKSPWTTLDIDDDMSAAEVVVNRRRPFRQGNSGQNLRMRAWLADNLAPLAKQKPVLELFAGSGNFTEVLAAAGFASVVAVEGVAEAVAALDAKSLPGVTARLADLFVAANVKALAQAVPDAQILVLDPPRDGFRELATLVDGCRALTDVLSISCDLATFARDAEVLLGRGFQLVEVQPLDQFPHTPHVELLAVLRRP